MDGMVHVYTGNGKGKTTSAIGLAVRAAGAGLKVYIGQFVKGRQYSELNILDKLDNIDIEQFGKKNFIKNNAEEIDIKKAKEGYRKIQKVLNSNFYDLIILDEANIAVYFDLFSVEDLLDLIEKRNQEIEVVLTGRMANNKIIEYADLVTEMKEIKHYYKKGITARKGIEN
jgi:cob(I)alamin adenosyltransferase